METSEFSLWQRRKLDARGGEASGHTGLSGGVRIPSVPVVGQGN